MLTAGSTVTQMDLRWPKTVHEVSDEPVPTRAGTRGCPTHRAPVPLPARQPAQGAAGMGEAPGGAMWQRQGQWSHLITKASCPHFHRQTPRGWLLVAITPCRPSWPWEKPTLLRSHGKGCECLAGARASTGSTVGPVAEAGGQAWRVGARISPARLPSARPGGGRGELLRLRGNSPGFHHPRDGSAAATTGTRLPVG